VAVEHQRRRRELVALHLSCEPVEVGVAEAVFVREAVARIAQGESTRGVARWLNQQGSRTTSGREWIGQALLATLSDGRVAGLRRLNGQIYEGNWTPIVTREQWQQMMSVLQDRHRPRKRREPALLGAGLVRCGECGSGSSRPQR
jgi:hypothetical protein